MNVDNINILSAAKLSENPSPVKPNKILNIAIGAVIGIMLGIGLAFLIGNIRYNDKRRKRCGRNFRYTDYGISRFNPIRKSE